MTAEALAAMFGAIGAACAAAAAVSVEAIRSRRAHQEFLQQVLADLTALREAFTEHLGDFEAHLTEHHRPPAQLRKPWRVLLFRRHRDDDV